MTEPRDIIARGRTLTGRKLLQAIEGASTEIVGGRGIIVNSVAGKAVVSLKGRPIIPKVRSDIIIALITGSDEIAANRWRYTWAEAEMDPVAPSPPDDFNWSILAGGRSSSELGEAFNRYELRHNAFFALGHVLLTSLPGDVTVLPVNSGELVELTEYTSTPDVPADKDDEPEVFKAVWFDRPNGANVMCTPLSILEPPPTIGGQALAVLS